MEKAFLCLVEAAHLGHGLSQINLGNFYSSGKGTMVNKREASRWYREAFKGGYREGALNLAIDRKNEGRLKSAIIWLKKAVAMHDGEASVELAKLYLTSKRRRAEARQLLRDATSMSSSDISEDTREEAHRLSRLLEA
jgi:TPR repeat protein